MRGGMCALKKGGIASPRPWLIAQRGLTQMHKHTLEITHLHKNLTHTRTPAHTPEGRVVLAGLDLLATFGLKVRIPPDSKGGTSRAPVIRSDVVWH